MAAAPHVARGVDNSLQDLEIYRDGVGEVLSLAARRRNAGGNGVADIANLIGGERRPGRRFGPGRLGHDADRLEARQVGSGEDTALRLGWHVNRADPGMGMRAADKRHFLRAGQFDGPTNWPRP